MNDSKRDWKIYGFKLESIEREIDALAYTSIFLAQKRNLPEHSRHEIASGSLTIEHIETLLDDLELAPSGLNLISVKPPPQPPKVPPIPGGTDLLYNVEYWGKRAARAEKRIAELSSKFARIYFRDSFRASRLRANYALRKPKAIELLSMVSIRRHAIPAPLLAPFKVRYNATRRIVICKIHVPDLTLLPILKQHGDSFPRKWKAASARECKKAFDTVLYSLCIRAAYLIARSDAANNFDTVAVNANLQSANPATGLPRDCIVASLNATKSEIGLVRPEQLECESCFRHFGGVYSSSIKSIVPVQPII